MPHTQSVPGTKRLLKALPRKDRRRFLAAREPVYLVFAEILADPGERIRHVYFPTGSFISLLSPTGGSDSLEVGMVGDEGMLGVRRVGATKAAVAAKRKLISYRRGDITVLGRKGLEAASSGHYEADRATYAQMMG